MKLRVAYFETEEEMDRYTLQADNENKQYYVRMGKGQSGSVVIFEEYAYGIDFEVIESGEPGCVWFFKDGKMCFFRESNKTENKLNNFIGLAMALAKRTGNSYGLHPVFNGASEIWRWEENNEEDLSVLVFYRYGYDDYKYDVDLLKEDGWRIKDDHGAGYWMIKSGPAERGGLPYDNSRHVSLVAS